MTSFTYLRDAVSKKPKIEFYQLRNQQLSVIRLDALHPQLGGNKAFKLIGFVEQLSVGDTIVSFGGEHSNHLYALAALTDDFHVIALVRRSFTADGREQDSAIGAVLSRQGVQVEHVSSTDYQLARKRPEQKRLMELYQADCLIPEGGNGTEAAIGLSRLAQHLDELFPAPTEFHLAAGTGTTARYLAKALPTRHSLVVTPVVTPNQLGFDRLANATLVWHQPRKRFARMKPADVDRLRDCLAIGLELDCVYNVHAMQSLLNSSYSGDKCLIHTGGLRK